MNRIKVLDCTLRDGGYCNQWEFGKDNIKTIVKRLVEANIDIIECGFLTNKTKFDENFSKYNNIDEFSTVIKPKNNKKIYVAMMNYGEYDVDDMPEYDGTSIDGIRVAFHKKNRYEALELCKKIKAKGYKVFIQAMVSLAYTDEEFLDMITVVNEFEPYAFYIVDSFGMMKGKDLVRFFYLIENNLKKDIWTGFHSHNNLQLAYSNAQALVNMQTNRNLIIDSSIYGMGRGAGNLNTELFIDYLNENIGSNYELKPILTVIDNILNEFYQKNFWGYSLANYISAIHNAHPNYAGYLDDKKTLTYEDMNEIFDMMPDEKKVSFDKKYIEELYLKYMNIGKTHTENSIKLKNKLIDRKVLLIAPGKSSTIEKEKIKKFIDSEDVITMSINYEYDNVDYIFVSNLRRFNNIDSKKYNKLIVTSNIPTNETFLQVKYFDLINDEESVKDNAGMMAIKFLIKNGVKDIYLAGFDGYSHEAKENYANDQLEFITKNAILDSMNEGMNNMLNKYSKEAIFKFITTPKYIKI